MMEAWIPAAPRVICRWAISALSSDLGNRLGFLQIDPFILVKSAVDPIHGIVDIIHQPPWQKKSLKKRANVMDRKGEYGKSIVFYPVQEGFLPQHALPPPLIAAIDIAARPEVYCQRG